MYELPNHSRVLDDVGASQDVIYETLVKLIVERLGFPDSDAHHPSMIWTEHSYYTRLLLLDDDQFLDPEELTLLRGELLGDPEIQEWLELVPGWEIEEVTKVPSLTRGHTHVLRITWSSERYATVVT